MDVAPVSLVLQRVGLCFVQNRDGGGGQDDPCHAGGSGGLQDPLGAFHGGADHRGWVLRLGDGKGRGGVYQRRDASHRLGPTGVGFEVGLDEGQDAGMFGEIGRKGGADLLGPVHAAQGSAHRIPGVQQLEGHMFRDETGDPGQ